MLTGLVLLPLTTITAQNVITLKDCYERAYRMSPIAAEKEAHSQIWQLKDRNLSKGWLPTLDANGNFVYNSSVVNLAEVIGTLPVPGMGDLIRPMPHEQYKVTLEINQLIYDGGAIRGARELEEAERRVNEQQTDAELYQLRGQITSHYFNVLLLDKQKEWLLSFVEIINRRISSLQNAAQNGVAMRSDIDVLTAEKLKLEQQITETVNRKASLLSVLSDMTGSHLDTAATFVVPSSLNLSAPELVRPELKIFDLRKEQLDLSLRIIDSKRMPKVFGFASLGYGNPPGNNFFKDEFAPFAIVGAGVKWNVFDWQKSARERQIVSFRHHLIDSRKSDLTNSLQRLLKVKMADMENLESMIEADVQIISLRKSISSSAAAQYENGTITASEYLNELNNEKQALINLEIHQISLARARVEFLNITGQDIN